MPTAVTTVTLASRAQRSDEALFQEVDGESVLLDLSSERYFGLDPVGTRIWSLLEDHDSLQAIADILCEEYDADPERIGTDLVALIGQLRDAGLVTLN